MGGGIETIQHCVQLLADGEAGAVVVGDDTGGFRGRNVGGRRISSSGRAGQTTRGGGVVQADKPHRQRKGTIRGRRDIGRDLVLEGLGGVVDHAHAIHVVGNDGDVELGRRGLKQRGDRVRLCVGEARRQIGVLMTLQHDYGQCCDEQYGQQR